MKLDISLNQISPDELKNTASCGIFLGNSKISVKKSGLFTYQIVAEVFRDFLVFNMNSMLQ